MLFTVPSFPIHTYPPTSPACLTDNALAPSQKRDAEHRESLSTTLRTLRADSLRQSDNISRLQERYTEAQRKVDIADAEEAALKTQLKAAEAAAHKLKDDAARTKKLVADTRATCANEVRKRDRQIDALKKAVADAGRARGERRSAGITTIHVTGDVGGDEPPGASGGGRTTAATADEDYDLRQETNGFLAHLAKGLSEENETLLSLIRKTNESLKGMSGFGKSEGAASGSGDGHVVVLPTNPEDLAVDIENVLAHLRTMLTNPSFVPLEEVVVREQEIFRLRDGWEKMEDRWQEAVHLIDSWRRRMAADGRPIDMEDLKMGLRLSPVRIRTVDETAQHGPFKLSTLKEEEDEGEEEEEEEQNNLTQQKASPSPAESLHLVPAPEYRNGAPGYEEAAPEYDEHNDIDDSDAESSIFQDDVDVNMEDLQQSEPNVEILQHSTESTVEDSPSMTLPPPPKITPLEETSLARNRKPAGALTEKSRKRSGTLIDDGPDETDEATEAPVPPPHGNNLGQSPQKRLKVSSDRENEKPMSRPNSDIFTDSNSSLDSILLKPSSESSAPTTSSKTTAKPSRSKVVSKKEATAPARPATTARTIRVVGQEKKETSSRPLTRTRTTRATATTTTSASSRATASKPEPPKSARRAPAPTAAADMPPPPRPTRTRSASHANQDQPKANTTQAEKKSSPAENPPTPLPTLDTSSSTHDPVETPSASTGSKRDRNSAQDSPTRSPTKSASRLPLPRPLPQPPQQSPITVASIAAKLAASERQANAARVRAKLKAARLSSNSRSKAPAGSSAGRVSGETTAVDAEGERDPVKRDRDASNGSTSLDENGTAGGVSILPTESSSAASSIATAAAPSGRDQDGDEDEGRIARETAAAAPQQQRKKTRRGANTEIEIPPSPTPRKKRAAVGVVAGAGTGRASPAKAAGAGGKRVRSSRAEKVASRRRSTLSPWELQSLIAGDVVPPGAVS